MVVPEAGMLHWRKELLDWCCCLSYNVKDMESCYNIVHIDPDQSLGKMNIPVKVGKKLY